MADASRDLYGQAFGMLACAWAYTLDRKPLTLEYAYRTLRFLDDAMAESRRGYIEGDGWATATPKTLTCTCSKAFTALHEVTGDEFFRLRADSILSLLDQHFMASAGRCASTSTMPAPCGWTPRQKSSRPTTITNGSGFA